MSKAPNLDAFLEAADYFIGMTEDPMGSNYFTDSRADEMFQLLYDNQVAGAGPGQAWCAMLVSAVACKVDVDWNVVYPGVGVGAVTSNTVDACNGTWIPGPYFTDGAVVPMPGDLVSFVGDPASTYSGYQHGGHIGIVRYVYDSSFESVEGNVSDACKLVSHGLSDTRINGFVRPDWSIVGDDVTGYTTSKTSGSVKGGSGGSGGSGDSSGTTYVPLYTTRNDRHDMTIREVCCMDTSYNLTNRSTDIGIGILNFTSFLADLYDYMGWGIRQGGGSGSGGTTTKVDTSGLSQFKEEVKVAVDFFLSAKYSASAACGIVAGLMVYSRLNVTFYEKKANDLVLEGIGAWEPTQYQEMKSRAGYDGKYTLSGQLDYVLFELERDFANLVSTIKNKQLGSVQAEEVASKVIWNYNKHYRHSDYEKSAKDYAKDFYDALVFTTTSTYGGGKDLRDIDGYKLEAKFTVQIPSDIWQSGIDGNYTSYSYFYHRWNSSSAQRRIADQWAYEGYPYDRGSIALVGGYYCVAVSTTFGYVGDIIVVTLANGDSFAAIIADSKNPNDSNCGEYGHYYDNGALNVIEWERICTYNGEVQTEGSSYNIVDGIELGSWAGQDVTGITNYGSYGI